MGLVNWVFGWIDVLGDGLREVGRAVFCTPVQESGFSYPLINKNHLFLIDLIEILLNGSRNPDFRTPLFRAGWEGGRVTNPPLRGMDVNGVSGRLGTCPCGALRCFR